jgi:RNA polymerase sigma-70 factor (ECF subfamily)
MEPHSAESRIRTHWLKQDYQACAVIVLECYGTEVYSLLLARFQGRPDLAEDAFSEFSEDLWRSLPSFGWRCAMRSWCYRL